MIPFSVAIASSSTQGSIDSSDLYDLEIKSMKCHRLSPSSLRKRDFSH